MRLFSRIFGSRDKKNDEPFEKQKDDFLRSSTFSGGVNNKGCDQIPGAYGYFGITPTNPIPVNGVVGELVYIFRLRSKTGVGFMYHRLGSFSSPPSKNPIDHYELVAVDASEWYDLYFDCYYPRRSMKVPTGLTVVPWSSLDDTLKMLSKLPLYGANIKVDNFPYGLPEVIESCGRLNDFEPGLGAATAKKIRHTLNIQEGKWKRDRIRSQKQLSYYGQIIKEEPLTADDYFKRGIQYLSTDKSKAMTDFTLAIALDQNHKDSYLQRGMEFYELKQFDKALSDFKKVLEINPNNAEAHAWVGNCYLELQEYDEALFCFLECIKIKPLEPLYNYKCGFILSKLKDYESAIKIFEAAIIIDPNYADAYYQRGIAFYELKNYDAALKDFDQVLNMRPNDSRGYYCIGLVYEKLKDYEKSIEFMTKAISLNPAWSPPYRVRGVISRILNRDDDAIMNFSKAIEINPKDTKSYIYRSMLYKKKGEYYEAKKDLILASSIDPKNKGAREKLRRLIKVLINQIDLSEGQRGKEIGTKELGRKYYSLVLDRAKQFFNDYQLMKALGINKTNDSVTEIQILNMFSIFNCIRSTRLGGDIRDSIIHYIIDSYMDYLIEYTPDKGIDEEILLREAESLKILIATRFTQYSEISKKYETTVLKEDGTNDSYVELEIGNDLIKVLNNITSHEYDEKNVFPGLYFLSFFMEVIMDKHITETINSDVDKYDIKKSEFSEEMQKLIGNEYKVTKEADGMISIKRK